MNSVEFLYGGGGEALVSMKKLPVKIECFQEKQEEITDEKIMKLYQMNPRLGNEAAIEKYGRYVYSIIHKNIRHIGESWGDFLYGKKVSWYHYFIDIVNLFLIVRCGNGPICKSGK